MKRRINPTGSEQLRMRSTLDDATGVNDDDLVGCFGRGEAVGDGDRRAATSGAVDRSLEPDLGLWVDSRRGLVEQEEVGLGQVGPDQCHELPLASRE